MSTLEVTPELRQAIMRERWAEDKRIWRARLVDPDWKSFADSRRTPSPARWLTGQAALDAIAQMKKAQ